MLPLSQHVILTRKLATMMVRTAATAAAAFAVACLPLPCSGFLPSQTSHVRPPVAATAPPLFAATTLVDDPSFKRPDTLNDGMISEEACTDAASLMRRVNVPVPTTVSSTGEVGISYIHWAASPAARRANGGPTLPLVMVHGFDSSCLEYRRLGPKLAALGVDAYAVDLLGWGYTQLEGVDSFSAQAKVDALKGFWTAVGNDAPVCVAGASLGGAAAIEFASANPDVVKGAVFIDAQGFVDGVGPMAMLPKPVARLGVKVLKSVPLRSSANTMSYYDADTYATDDALRVGRMHCLRDGWDDALVSFMLSGGFSPSQKVAQIEAPSLILWGRQDGILEKEFAQRFLDTLPDATLQWIEECGHVPHLEQPEETARVISEFLRRPDKFGGVGSSSSSGDGTIAGLEPDTVMIVGGITGALAAAAAAATLGGAEAMFGQIF